MTAKLYGMLHSHAVLAARLMLERCGVEYEPRDIMPGLHARVVRAAGFRAGQCRRCSSTGVACRAR
jgi:hypothetical protein